MLRARSGGDARFARRAVRAVAEGWARVAFKGTPYPTLVAQTGAMGGGVEGVLLAGRVPARAMRGLRAYEGRCYGLVPLRVVTACGRPRAARAFAAPARMADASAPWSPGAGGLGRVPRGARDASATAPG